MFGFSKHCKTCGIDVKKENAEKRFGKHFCSPEHAEQYIEKRKEEEKLKEEERRSRPKHGGCC